MVRWTRISKKYWIARITRLIDGDCSLATFVPDGALQKLILASKHAAGIIENYFEDTGRVGVIMEGTGIDHAHVKSVPMHGTENLKRGEWQQVLSGKEFWFDKYEGWICSGGGPKADP